MHRFDTTERNYRLAFFGGVVLEGLFLLLFLLCADLTNKTHVLLLIATVMSYSIVILGLVALGAHVNRTTLRILQAIDAGREGGGERGQPVERRASARRNHLRR
ncbi:MAG TPA: hypothetical protein VKB93_30140 [Thermoanaerobaculia bacterium]|nr:hypothetical protein [Thermoanaerobaculia bacterium]